MRIEYNPLYKLDGKTPVGALTSAPAGDNITFDLPGRAIYTKQTKFKGTDHTYAISASSPLSATSTNAGDDATTVALTLDVQSLRLLLLDQWDISVDFAAFTLDTHWAETNINLTTLPNGSYLLLIDYEGVLYTGTFSLVSSINTDDEIILHSCGNITKNNITRGRVYAKIAGNGTPKLMLAGQIGETNISKFKVRIKQLG